MSRMSYYCSLSIVLGANKGRRRKGAQVEKPSRLAKRASTTWDFQTARDIHSTAFFHLALRAKESRGGQRCAFRRRGNKGFVVASSLVLLPLTPLVLLIPHPRLAAQRLPRSKECSQNKLKGHAKSRLLFSDMGKKKLSDAAELAFLQRGSLPRRPQAVTRCPHCLHPHEDGNTHI